MGPHKGGARARTKEAHGPAQRRRTGHRGSARGRQAGRLLVRYKTGIPHTGRAETGCQLGGFPYGNMQHTPTLCFCRFSPTRGALPRPPVAWGRAPPAPSPVVGTAAVVGGARRLKTRRARDCGRNEY